MPLKYIKTIVLKQFIQIFKTTNVRVDKESNSISFTLKKKKLFHLTSKVFLKFLTALRLRGLMNH